MKKCIGIMVCLSFTLLFFASSGFASAGITRPVPLDNVDTAPGFSLETVGGRKVALEDYQGKNVILFFFTTWCPYCVQKFPLLEKKVVEFEQEGIVLLPINTGESKAKVASFRRKKKITFDILLDESMAAAQNYSVRGVPSFFLIGTEGTILYEGNDMPWNYQEIFSKK